MPAEDRIPVVVATGQAIERNETVSPLDLAVRAAEAAFSKAPSLRARIERVSMVSVLTGGGSAPAAALARRMSLSPRATEMSTIGGNSPQWLVNRAASDISCGEVQAVLVAGAEAQRSKRLRGAQTTEQMRLDAQLPPDPLVGDDRPGAGNAELAAGLIAPVHLYALFESVLAHRAGRGFAEHRTVLGELMSPFSEVAAKHPYAWFAQALTASEISEVSTDNRLVSEPYTKRMCAIMQVDQGAAVVVCSLAAARAAGLADHAVFVWSGADASDVWFPVARPDPGSSPGIAAAASAALLAAGIDVDDLSAIDLYSCFPCVVEMATAALGIDGHDPRGLTVTGGLPYFGGPGNDYTLHSIATMADHLCQNGGTGLVTGLGWYATKHSVGVYSANPSPGGWRPGDTSAAQREIDASAVDVAEPADLEALLGTRTSVSAVVVASTVGADREGEITSAPVIARLEDGRHLAVAAEAGSLASLAGRNLVGERIEVAGSPPRYVMPG